MTRTELWNMLIDCSVKNKSFPRPEIFAAYSKISEETIKKVYRMWIQEGKLEKVNNTLAFVDKNIQSQLTEDEVRQLIKPSVKPSIRKKMEQQNNLILKIIKIIATIIGSILTTVSIHFTFGFNKMGMSILWGFLLSASVVCFMSFAFTIRSYVTKRTTRALIVMLWVLGISYSVFTAVSGQFNDFRKYTASDNSVQIESKNKIYEKQLKALEKKQEELLHWREQESEYTLNPDLKVENRNTWKDIQTGVEELKKVESDIMNIQEKLLGNINTEVILEETVYNWLAGFLGVSADIIQFIIILFPALFIDLCSTVCFTFALGKETNV